MKKLYINFLKSVFFLLFLFPFFVSNLSAQNIPVREWDKTLGGSGSDNLYSLQYTSDGGYTLRSSSIIGISGDKTETSRGGSDYWIVKLASPAPLSSTVSISADQVTSLSGTQVVVPVRVDDFTDILTAQGTITFDTTVVTYAGVEQFAFSDLTNASFGTGNTATGQLTFSWDDSDFSGETLADSSVLFAIRFNVVGNPGDASPIDFVTVPTPLEFTDSSYSVVSHQVQSGEVRVPALNIATGSLAASAFCAGDVVAVPFTVTSAFNSGNIFTAELSDENGSFASPTVIGTLTATGSRTVTATIPAGIASDSTYRIRIIASDPVVVGSDNGTDLTINSPLAPVIADGPTTICSFNGRVVLSTVNDSTYSYQWYQDSVLISGAIAYNYTVINASGNYTVVVTENGCSVTSNPVPVTINSPPLASIFNLTPTTFCQGDSVILFALTGTDYSYSWFKDGTEISGANAARYFAKQSGSYTVEITENGCSAVSLPVAVTVTPAPLVSIQASATTIGLGDSINLSVLNPDTSITYSWAGRNLNDTAGTTVIATPTARGTYIYTVTADNGNCTETDQVTIEVGMPADVGITRVTRPLLRGCYTASEIIRVRINNFGTQPVTAIPVEVAVTGAVNMILTDTYSGTIAANDSVIFTIGNLDMSAGGIYNFTARTLLSTDTNAWNDEVTETRISEPAMPLPLSAVTFTGFTGADLSTVFPGWYEATGESTPRDVNSGWRETFNQNQLNSLGSLTGCIRFNNTVKRHWLVGPSFIPTADTRLFFEAALTTAGGTNTAVMQPDDKLQVMVSTDCGVSFTPLYVIDHTHNLPNQLSQYSILLDQYDGQKIILAFLAYEGTSRPANFDLHLDNIMVSDPTIYETVKNQCLTTRPAWAGASNEWRELIYDGKVVGAIHDRGNNLGRVSIDFNLNDTSGTGILYDQMDVPLLGRYFKINAENSVFTGNSIGLRLYILESEIQELAKAAGSGVVTVNDLSITQYSGPNENCMNTDNDYATATLNDYLPYQLVKIPYKDGYMLELEVFDHFSEFFIKGDPTPLPVNMISFTATKKGADALLEWHTAMEEDNAGFEVQVSADGFEYRKLGWLNASTSGRYSFLDQELNKKGQRYYRLKQVDFNNTESFYGPRTVNFDWEGMQVEAWPNPFANQLTVNISSDKAEELDLMLTDVIGRVVLNQKLQVEKGTQQTNLDLTETLPAGVYLLKLQGGKNKTVLKLVKE